MKCARDRKRLELVHYTQKGLICWLFVSLYVKHEFKMYLEIHATTFCCLRDLTFDDLDNLYPPAKVVRGKRADF